MSIEAIIISLIAASPGLIALVGQLRKDAAAAHKTGTEREQLENEITEKVLTRADTEIVKLNQRVAMLESDLSKERLARQVVETTLAQEQEARKQSDRRISVLEVEREEWKIGIGLLLGQLVDAKIKPTWTPRGIEIPEVKNPKTTNGGSGGGLMKR